MANNQTFDNVRALSPGRSVFNLSYSKKFTCDMGEIIPVMCDEVVPGDVINLAQEMVIRMQPLVAPVLHEINALTHYFFVPYRLLDQDGTFDWEDFISGGPTGESVEVLPRWTPTTTAKGSLWDYMGMPVGINPTGALPLAFPRDAYNFIYNTFYRDENLIAEVAHTSEAILIRAWEKDYFTSSLPWQQRGTAPALPISGTTEAIFSGMTPAWLNIHAAQAITNKQIQTADAAASSNIKRADSAAFAVGDDVQAYLTPAALPPGSNTVDLSTATTFDIADLRLAFQIQKWMERNARGGGPLSPPKGKTHGIFRRNRRRNPRSRRQFGARNAPTQRG